MKDFLGRNLDEGDWVAYGGGGNSSGEYGMILARVIDAKDKLKLLRLTCRYISGIPEIKTRKITVSNYNKYVMVSPPPKAIELFDKAEKGLLSGQEKGLISKWIHGSSHQAPWN
jgi:hypothetical protein